MLAVCLEPAERPSILSLGSSASFDITLEAETLRAKGALTNSTPHAEHSQTLAALKRFPSP